MFTNYDFGEPLEEAAWEIIKDRAKRVKGFVKHNRYGIGSAILGGTAFHNIVDLNNSKSKKEAALRTALAGITAYGSRKLFKKQLRYYQDNPMVVAKKKLTGKWSD
jgi:hypothetical protein